MSDRQKDNKMMPRRKSGKLPYVPKGSGPLSFLEVKFGDGFAAAATFQDVAGECRCVSAPPCLMAIHGLKPDEAIAELRKVKAGHIQWRMTYLDEEGL